MKQTIAQRFAAQLNKALAGEPHGKQKEMAEAIGVTPSRLNNIIRGRRGGDEDLRREICKYLGRDYEEFLFGRGGAVTQEDDELQEFVELYRRYGSRAFLESCIDRLREIKSVIEK
ncbi:MAG TPA: hypothetical protein DCS42_04170 [Nitrospiraceae bacterium]|nr:hypothetical protein [Nitrospiraceae bacterium]